MDNPTEINTILGTLDKIEDRLEQMNEKVRDIYQVNRMHSKTRSDLELISWLYRKRIDYKPGTANSIDVFLGNDQDGKEVWLTIYLNRDEENDSYCHTLLFKEEQVLIKRFDNDEYQRIFTMEELKAEICYLITLIQNGDLSRGYMATPEDPPPNVNLVYNFPVQEDIVSDLVPAPTLSTLPTPVVPSLPLLPTLTETSPLIPGTNNLPSISDDSEIQEY